MGLLFVFDSEAWQFGFCKRAGIYFDLRKTEVYSVERWSDCTCSLCPAYSSLASNMEEPTFLQSFWCFV